MGQPRSVHLRHSPAVNTGPIPKRFVSCCLFDIGTWENRVKVVKSWILLHYISEENFVLFTPSILVIFSMQVFTCNRVCLHSSNDTFTGVKSLNTSFSIQLCLVKIVFNPMQIPFIGLSDLSHNIGQPTNCFRVVSTRSLNALKPSNQSVHVWGC